MLISCREGKLARYRQVDLRYYGLLRLCASKMRLHVSTVAPPWMYYQYIYVSHPNCLTIFSTRLTEVSSLIREQSWDYRDFTSDIHGDGSSDDLSNLGAPLGDVPC